jgi:hypothetical protein
MKVYYVIKLKDNTAKFIWSSSPESENVDLEVQVNPREMIEIAKRFKCDFKDNIIYIPNFDVYNRLLIYAYIRPLLNEKELMKVMKIISDLSYIDAFYWASKFREKYWYENKWEYNLAEAFKLFFLE